MPWQVRSLNQRHDNYNSEVISILAYKINGVKLNVTDSELQTRFKVDREIIIMIKIVVAGGVELFSFQVWVLLQQLVVDHNILATSTPRASDSVSIHWNQSICSGNL